ncbi:hypothetical protein V3C99_015516 [Haemonchus contortus]
MFTAVAGGILMVLICTLSIFLYIPVLYVFYRRPEFNSLVAYQLMFWTGIMDVGQLIVFDVSGVVATFQWNRFPSYVNKFLGSTLYALWFSMLFLSIFTTLNRFVSVVFRSHYNTLFDKNHVKIIYLLAFLIFLLPWLTKLTPYSSYCFSEWNLEWHYMPEDNRVLTRLSHYFGTYGILVFLVPSAITYTIIFIYIFSQKERSMKRTEVIFTIQQLLVSLLYLFGFIYWSTIDVWSTGTLIMNFFSNLTWIIMIALNPFIYLIVNRRLRRSVLILLRCNSCAGRPTAAVIPMNAKTVMIASNELRKGILAQDTKKIYNKVLY